MKPVNPYKTKVPGHFFPAALYIISFLRKSVLVASILLSFFFLLPDSCFHRLFGQNPAEAGTGADDFSARISGQILRLHILADNDSPRDQEIKLHVRDAVLSYVQPLLSDASSVCESEELLLQALPELIECANNALEQYGADYRATACISTEFFPIRRYGSLLLPPGDYRALCIVLGQGRGHNWWCMLYPSLCFTEGITGTVSLPEKTRLGQLLDEDDYFLLFAGEEKPEPSLRIAKLFRILKQRSRCRFR